MDDRDAHQSSPRPPTEEDIVNLCRRLNNAGVDYILIGGIAVIYLGHTRATKDIDLLVTDSAENVARLKTALSYLEDGSVKDLQPEDLKNYVVVRLMDEIVVDLLARACGQTYLDLKPFIEIEQVEGVSIPFLSPEGLLKTKQGIRPQDIIDRQFLEMLIQMKNQRK